MEDVKFAMIASVNEALKVKNQDPYATIDEVISQVIDNVNASHNAKIAGVAAATMAVKYKQKNPKATDKQVFQHIMDQSSEIINSIMPEKE